MPEPTTAPLTAEQRIDAALAGSAVQLTPWLRARIALTIVDAEIAAERAAAERMRAACIETLSAPAMEASGVRTCIARLRNVPLP